MKTNKLLIFLAAMLLLNGCEFRDTDPDKPDQEDVLSETADTDTVSADTEAAVDYEEAYKPVLDAFFRLAWNKSFTPPRIEFWKAMASVRPIICCGNPDIRSVIFPATEFRNW